jgi:subtilisin family serine protease
VGTADADVDAPAAWDATTTGDDVVVAVIDLGVDVDHPDLAASMWTNQVEATGTPGVDDDGNGYLDDVHGWDFKQDDADPSPGSGGFAWHGTHVAGIVAAERGNATGIAGVCGACRIMALRFDLSLGQELEAIEYAAANGADVINMSFGSPIWSNAERTAIEAAGDAGVLTVVSAGNSSLDNDTATFIGFSSAPDFPASYTLPTILSVAASNDKDQYAYGSECDQRAGPRWLCAFTSWGHDSVDVAAPGVDIMSTVPPPLGQFDEGYLFSDGTSMAAPLVAGIAGLVQHHNPSYGPLALKNAVMRSVDRPRALRMLSSWAEQIGVGKRPIEGRFTRTQGRVNALEALTAPTTNATPLTDGNIDGAKAMRATVRGRVVWPADVNDVYRKRLGGRNRYRVMLNGPPGKDLDLLVWIPDATEIHQFTRSCFQRRGVCPFLKAYPAEFDADEQVTFRVANTGVFFIQVQGWYSSGSYTLSVRRL